MADINSEILNKNSVVVITGGAKGITSQCSIKIAETAKCKLILIGRSAILDAEPKWAIGRDGGEELQKSALQFFRDAEEKITPKKLQSEIKKILSSREINSTLKKVRDSGGSAIYISADVTDRESLLPQIEAAVKDFGPVTGIIHGAGNLADKLIENKTASDFDLVVNTKVNGLKNIIQLLDPKPLKFLVLFSSVAGFFGNIGQTDYAIANEILNKSAYIIQKSLPDCRVISINWGPWDSGMVSPELKRLFLDRNIQLISADFGVKTIIDELTRNESNVPQIVVGNPLDESIEIGQNHNSTITVLRQIDHKDNPFLNDHFIGRQAVLPATCASAWLADTCVSLNPGFTFSQMEDFKIFKGLTFNNDNRLYQLELKLVSVSDSTKKIYEVIVTSQEENNREVFHYSGRVTLIDKIPDPPIHPSIGQLNLDQSSFKSGNDLYKDGTLFHGPSFQGVKELLQLNEKRVITRVSLPEMSTQNQGQFTVRSTNPFINDAAVQSLLIWTQEFYDAPCLPSRLHQWDHYKIVPFGLPVWVILNVTYHNEHAVVGDILVQDEEGCEYFKFSGLEGTISKQLKRFIGRKDQ